MWYLQKKNRTKQPKNGGLMRLVSGSPCWARTNDPAVNSRMLYRLS